MVAGEGDDLPVSLLPIDGTYPTATAQWEKRNIALEIPNGMKSCASSAASACWSARTPSSAPSLRFQGSGRRAAHFQGRSGPLEGHEGPQVHLAGGARRLHRLHAVHTGLPGQEQERSEASRINMVAQPPIREQEAANWSSSSRSPRPTASCFP